MPAKGAIQSRTAPAAAGSHQYEGVRLVDVSRSYGRVEALAGVSLRAEPGEVVAVVGPSGCGKSTLLELVCGLQAPDAGKVSAGRARQRGAGAAGARAEPPCGACPGRAGLRRVRAGGLRVRAPLRAVGWDAPARR